jgi:hypothetical protein
MEILSLADVQPGCLPMVVIGADGHKLDLVLVDIRVDEGGEVSAAPRNWNVEPGQRLVAQYREALPMFAPRWDGSSWIETGEPEGASGGEAGLIL